MKKNIFFMIFVGFLGMSCTAQKSSEQINPAEKPIKALIMQFASAADVQDAVVLDGLLDANYRIVMNQLFGSADVMVMDKATFLSRIKSKEFGGDKRTITIEQVAVNGNTANVKATFKGAKMTFVSLLQLVKTSSGAWKLVSDMPVIL